MVAATYIATSILWWAMERNFKSVYALTAPWVFFGLAFLFLGVAPFCADWRVEDVITDVATCFYAAGASSGALTFALNFGDEGMFSCDLFVVPSTDLRPQVVRRRDNGSPEL